MKINNTNNIFGKYFGNSLVSTLINHCCPSGTVFFYILLDRSYHCLLKYFLNILVERKCCIPLFYQKIQTIHETKDIWLRIFLVLMETNKKIRI